MAILVDGDLYQWDTGRVVMVDPDIEYDVHEVHFSTRKLDFAYVVKTYVEDGNTYCKIPNILLQQSYDIYCYEVRDNDDGEESISSTVFKITKRNRPLDYIYTEPEKYTYKELEERLVNLETSIEDLRIAIEEASVLANQAYTKAETVEETVDNTVSNIDEIITGIEDGSLGGNVVVEF